MLYIIRKGDSVPSHLLVAIEAIDWPAGTYVADILRQQSMAPSDYYFILSQDSPDANKKDQLVAFAAYVEQDIIADPAICPCIATVYVEPSFRQRGLSRDLVHLVELHAKAQNQQDLYINTQHQGLYEALGYQQFDCQIDTKGRTIYLYHKTLY